MSWYRRAFGAHYPLLYGHRDTLEAARCLELLPRLAPYGTGPVLDLGCGQGRHLRLLAEMGIVAVGLDLSATLLRLARRAASAPRLLRADMREIPLRAASVSAVLSLFTSFGYFDSDRDNAMVVHEIGRVLRDGGHWFLDYLNCVRVRRQLAGGRVVREREVGPLHVREDRHLAESPARVVKAVTLTPLPGQLKSAEVWGVGASGLHYEEEVALLDLAELDALAGTAGLRRVAAAGSYDGQPLDESESPRWLLVFACRKEPR